MAGIVSLAVNGIQAVGKAVASHSEIHQPDRNLIPASDETTSQADSIALAEAIRETVDWRSESALITTLAQAAAGQEKKPATRPPSHLLPRGQQVPSRTLPRPSPIGAFRDGSVRTIHPDMDPRVLQLLEQGGRAPIPWTTHRPGIAYGAPTNTLAGSDPTLRLLVEMQPNGEHGIGQMMQTYHGIRIRPGSSLVTGQQVFRWLQDFRHFNHGNIAHTRLVRPGALDSPRLADHRYVLFHPLQVGETSAGDELYGILNSIQSLVNGPQVAIRLFVDPVNQDVMGITLGDHMLSGARRWRVRTLPGGDLVVDTEAWFQRNGALNNVALQYGGTHAMATVWTRYLANIGHAATQDGGSWQYLPVFARYRPGITRNPFLLKAVKKQWIPPLQEEHPDLAR
ncbi:MAG: hypothetical protein VYB09_02460 [Planctomycetota bacterium]|nr:hypothetical protein [Planctomycetota bacterium]